ncbi:ASKHA domain-containing protein [Tissierella creatinophila]|uniref:Na(+)-translocating NADH-quinone reductase subunit F n=1 Tax=Tissierella creatinophila DSM 6911 TaxID=1123403 RepID=A0A1U7M4F1_TISCR|nr:ASKHA domain-containing protein [Tissierella creatinophila]OLS02192.1 Na(+)-translocating NADH-quinone reductase subunit F [Tissierella creatinophila DSM 6911]
MININIPRKNKTITTEAGDKLLKILIDNGEFVEGPCGGRGSCGRCKIKHISGYLPLITEDEKRFLSEEEINNGIRLACLISPTSDIQIDIIDQEKNHKVLTGGFIPEFNINPSIWKKVISIDKPTLGISTTYEDLFTNILGLEELDLNVLKNLKMQSGQFTVVYDGDKLMGLEYGNTTNEIYGVAVDIGTTTVVASLININTGEEIDSEAEINAQKNFGQDVLTRITYVVENREQGTLELQKAIVNSLNKMLNRICERQNLSKDRIYEMSIAANSTMIHILLGVESISLGKSPYAQMFSKAKNIMAREIGLDSMSSFARISTLPSVSSYIGADIVAGAFVAGLHKTDKRVLFIDIGTNGEIVLSDRGKLVSCSCAAGPALEGMNISSGMRASDGAIEEMGIGENEITLQVIGNTKPIGLCGSGILAAVREMLACGLVNERGNIVKPDSLESDDFRQKYLIVENKKRSIKINKDIRITQGDIRQVQLAKSAILSGFVALVNYVGLELTDLDEVIVAGQFGAHLPVESLVGTGILPKDVEKKIRYIGNSSKTGAYLSLISLDSRKEMNNLSKQIDYMELSVSEGYERLFVESSRFKI